MVCIRCEICSSIFFFFFGRVIIVGRKCMMYSVIKMMHGPIHIKLPNGYSIYIGHILQFILKPCCRPVVFEFDLVMQIFFFRGFFF